MRTDLKEQKEEVVATNLANNRARVARIRADTSDDKIRLAKAAFVNNRWDQADRLRQEVEAWKRAKKNAELQYLASAVQTNYLLKLSDEEAKRLMLEKREESAAQVRREREVLERARIERDVLEEERVKQAHDSMLGPKVLLTDAPLGDLPVGEGGGGGGAGGYGGGGGGGGVGGSAIELFGRLFGFRKSQPSNALVPTSLRGTTPRYQVTPGQTPGQTPRSARTDAPYGRTPRSSRMPSDGGVRV